MSEFRKKLEELFLKILESYKYPEKPSYDELVLMVSFAEIPPEPVNLSEITTPSDIMTMNLMKLMLANQTMNKPKIEGVDLASCMIDMLIKQKPEGKLMEEFKYFMELSKEMNKSFPNAKTINADEESVHSILKANTDKLDNLIVIRDEDGKVIGLQIK